MPWFGTPWAGAGKRRLVVKRDQRWNNCISGIGASYPN